MYSAVRANKKVEKEKKKVAYFFVRWRKKERKNNSHSLELVKPSVNPNYQSQAPSIVVPDFQEK
jgi:hypothetical protein